MIYYCDGLLPTSYLDGGLGLHDTPGDKNGVLRGPNEPCEGSDLARWLAARHAIHRLLLFVLKCIKLY